MIIQQRNEVLYNPENKWNTDMTNKTENSTAMLSMKGKLDIS